MHKERLPKGRSYFFIASSGKIVNAVDTWAGFDNLCHIFGNYFATMADAEAARIRVAGALAGNLTGNSFAPRKYGWLLDMEIRTPETVEINDEAALRRIRVAAAYIKKRTGSTFRITKINGGAVVERLTKGTETPANEGEALALGLFSTSTLETAKTA